VRTESIVIAHAHNRLQSNAYAGHAMAPAEYIRLFEDHPVRAFPESYVLDAYLDNMPLDLTRQFSEEELNRSPALVIVAAKSTDVFSVVPPVRDRLIDAARNPRLSGLYRMRHRAGQIVFERNIPSACATTSPSTGRSLRPACPYLIQMSSARTVANDSAISANC
jgi:hypothetical protein